MTPEQIKELIDRLLNSGEVLATEGFKLAVQQIRTYVVLDIAWAIFWFIASLILLGLGIWLYRRGKIEENKDRYNTDESMYYVLAGISWFCSLIVLVGTFYQAALAYMHASNPAWYAVRLLVGTFLK